MPAGRAGRSCAAGRRDGKEKDKDETMMTRVVVSHPSVIPHLRRLPSSTVPAGRAPVEAARVASGSPQRFMSSSSYRYWQGVLRAAGSELCTRNARAVHPQRMLLPTYPHVGPQGSAQFATPADNARSVKLTWERWFDKVVSVLSPSLETAVRSGLSKVPTVFLSNFSSCSALWRGAHTSLRERVRRQPAASKMGGNPLPGRAGACRWGWVKVNPGDGRMPCMAASKRRRSRGILPSGAATSPRPISLELELSIDEVETLTRVADFYPRNLGSFRFVVAATSREMRSKLQFMTDESKVLRSFAETMHERMASGGQERAVIGFTLRALVAFWGRLLASLNSPRSRRKLRPEEIARREALSARIQAMIADTQVSHSQDVEIELGLRRTSEQIWMRDALGGGPAAKTSA